MSDMKRKPSLEKESDIQRTILEHLWNKGIFAYRTNVVDVFKGGQRIRGLPKGHPDILCVRKGSGRYVGLEIKRDDSKQTTDQVAFEVNLKLVGAEYHVVRSLADVERIFP